MCFVAIKTLNSLQSVDGDINAKECHLVCCTKRHAFSMIVASRTMPLARIQMLMDCFSICVRIKVNSQFPWLFLPLRETVVWCEYKTVAWLIMYVQCTCIGLKCIHKNIEFWFDVFWEVKSFGHSQNFHRVTIFWNWIGFFWIENASQSFEYLHYKLASTCKISF